MGYRKVTIKKISAGKEVQYTADMSLKKTETTELSREKAVGFVSRFANLGEGECALVEAGHKGYLISPEDLHG